MCNDALQGMYQPVALYGINSCVSSNHVVCNSVQQGVGHQRAVGRGSVADTSCMTSPGAAVSLNKFPRCEKDHMIWYT